MIAYTKFIDSKTQTRPIDIDFLNLSTSNRLLAKVNLGSPSKNCLGVGICKIDLLSIRTTGTSFSPCSAIAMIKKHRDDRLAICFRKDSLSSRNMKTHFHDDTFLVEESYVLPISLVRSLNCQPIIHQGFYRVEECKEFLSVYF